MGPVSGDRSHLGWSPERTGAFRDAFYEFLPHIWINSKELGRAKLGDHLYRAQYRFFDFVFDGLSRDIHDFKHLKSRQMGISTGTRALGLFWLGMHDGLKGYSVWDTNAHKEEARLELIDMLRSLPDSYKFPRIIRENRDLVVLDNQSMVTFAVAGVKESKSSGTLGRSSGINFVMNSEMCSWAGGENVESFKNALAKSYHDRLYLWESTGRGFNLWKEMWDEAKGDVHHQACLFSGWWCKDDQIIAQSDPDFERYALAPLSEIEIYKTGQIKERYDHVVTQEQLAWVRRYLDPLAQTEGDAPAEYKGDTIKVREQCWIEEDSWASADAVFFHPDDLKQAQEKHVSNKFKTYMFQTGVEFVDTKVRTAPNSLAVQFKVWEEPEQDAYYIIAADVAHGTNEFNDRSAIQVLRAYADGCDQVAEYANPLISTKQFAWVIMAIAAWYAGDVAEIYLIVELNGPGRAVWDEIESLKNHLKRGYQSREIAEKGLSDVFRNVRNYIYTRPDSMSSGKAWMWNTSPGTGPSSKIRLMERLRDFFSTGQLRVRSYPTIEEMQSVARNGDKIEAGGTKKDDRVISLALGIQCWEQRARKKLSAAKRTRENESARLRMSVTDQARLFNQNMMETLFSSKRRMANRSAADARRAAWRDGGGRPRAPYVRRGR